DTLGALHPDWTPGALRSALDDADLRPLRKALKRHQRETTGLQGFLASLGRRAATGVFNLTHGGLYLATGAADHEGHYRDGVWRNWTGNYEARPASWHQPRTEEELCRLIAEATQLRVVGGGHTFNDSPLTAGTLINLDAYDEVLALDPKAQTLRVQAGMRLRDLGKLLEAHGLGLPVLGSTDAQSLGGLVATDLHGTGRDFGFLSQQIKSLRVIDAAGVARTVGPNDPLFHAVPGALGTCGVVSEIELQLVPAFRLEKRTLMVDRAATEATLDALLEQNEHVSFYYVGGAARTEAIRMHAWNRTDAPVTEHWERKKTLDELKDFAMSAWLPGLAELVVDLDEDNPISNLLAPDDRLVMPGSRAFGRHLFYRHDEIEYGVPYGAHRPCLDAILKLLRDADYFSVVEVRFSPDTSQGLIGPGAGRRTAYVELATPLSQPTDALFAQVEAILLAHGGQPHLGKKTNVTAAQMLQIHGDRFAAFQAVRQAQDPKGKFLNTFTRRVLGT
ncbi:MAG: FAD-binding protein, partial [Myxococcales bacterium]|nr:FAD-binding protein [Myxococcales bacterium]